MQADSQWFEPQEAKRFFAAGEAIFLLDPKRLEALYFEAALLPELLKPGRLYTEGAVVPAFGVERGFYTVMVRSTETEGAMVPLTHLAFSAGFLLSTETGELLIASAERMQDWDGDPRQMRTIRVAPGWYSVTVVAGIREIDDGEETEEWVVCFLLEPVPDQPEFAADLHKLLNIFG
jgi:hypothetical protein